jgi:hypothetical protein
MLCLLHLALLSFLFSHQDGHHPIYEVSRLIEDATGVR